MKKIKVTLIIALLVFVVAGCKAKSTEPLQSNQNPEVVQNNAETEKTVVKSQILKSEVADYTEVTSYVGDVDADGTDERIVLSTAAERGSNGEFLWNDGQNWALYVENSGVVYMLLDKYIQAGNVYFEVSDFYMKDGAKPKILVTETTGAGFSIKSFSFSKDDDGYVEEVLYDSGTETEAGINRRFSSFPEITE